MDEYNATPIEANDSQPPKKPIAALILSIASIVLCAVPVVGLVLGIVGLILGIKAKKNGAGGMAMAAIICSIVGILGGLTFGSCVGCTCGLGCLGALSEV